MRTKRSFDCEVRERNGKESLNNFPDGVQSVVDFTTRISWKDALNGLKIKRAD